MGCLLVLLAGFAPRLAAILFWIFRPVRWDLAFDNALVPLLGFVLAPWTTLAWVICAPGGITGFDVVLIVVAVLLDLATLLGSGGTSNRRRNRTAAAI